MKPLTPRQCEIIQLLANGFDYREIALCLNVQYSTVKNHMSEINKRLGTDHRVEAVIYAIHLDIIDLEVAKLSVISRIKSRYLI